VADRVRIEIGFYAGQTLSLHVEEKTAEAVERALQSCQEGAIRIDAEDGAYTVALSKVVYVKRFAREGRLGFTNP